MAERDCTAVKRVRRRTASGACVCGGVVLALVFAAGSARAAPISARELEGRKEYAAARYPEAVEIFAELFATTGDPVFLRNVARCYQKMNRFDEAITNFREYLKKAKKLGPGERDEVEGYIREMEAKRVAAPAAAGVSAPAPASSPEPVRAPTPAPAPAPSQVTPPGPVVVPLPPPVTAPATSSPAPSPASSTRVAPEPNGGQVISASAGATPTKESRLPVAGIAVAAGGVVLVGVGAAFGLGAKSAEDAVAKQWDPDRASTGKRDAKLQWVGYGAGAIALVTGVVMCVRHGGAAQGGQSATVYTYLGTHGFGLEGSF